MKRTKNMNEVQDENQNQKDVVGRTHRIATHICLLKQLKHFFPFQASSCFSKERCDDTLEFFSCCTHTYTATHTIHLFDPMHNSHSSLFPQKLKFSRNISQQDVLFLFISGIYGWMCIEISNRPCVWRTEEANIESWNIYRVKNKGKRAGSFVTKCNIFTI